MLTKNIYIYFIIKLIKDMFFYYKFRVNFYYNFQKILINLKDKNE